MKEKIDYLLGVGAIRDKANQILELTKEGKTHFEFKNDKLHDVADFVLEVIKENYPTLNIPFHSRWGHFQVGNVDRNERLDEMLKGEEALEKARAKLDLAITSVLLDAGAGSDWKYREDGIRFARSEGLAVASWHMFVQGGFSEDGSAKAQASKLKKISAKEIETFFQVSEENPLVGTRGRAGLLQALGACVEVKPDVFKDARPGNIIDHMIEKYGNTFAAKDLLRAVLDHFGPIWPSRITLGGVNLGDVWNYSKLGPDENDRLVPFHKLSQWLTYSLIEPIQEAGIKVTNAHEMTGLAEYRNGGLFVDAGLCVLKDPGMLNLSHRPDSDLIIEWRALTIACLDLLAPVIRERLGFTEEEFPLAKMLEGGTWHAGRKLAARMRSDCSPPIKLESDGTVF